MGRTVQTIKSSESGRTREFAGKKKVMKAPKTGIKALKSLNAAIKKTPAPVAVAATATDDGKKDRRRPRVGPSKVIRRMNVEEFHPKPVFPRAPFDRLVREIAENLTDREFRFSANAIDALLEGTKGYLTQLFREVAILTYHDGGRVTTMPKDIRAWRAIKLDSHKIDPGAHTVMSAELEKEVEMKKRGCNYWTTTTKNYRKRLQKPVISSDNVESVRSLVGSLNKDKRSNTEPISPSLPELSADDAANTGTLLLPPSPQKEDDVNALFE